jgi:NDP-sugar pyrophosphorylase family protein
VNQSIFSLAQLLRKFIRLGLVKGELFLGKWLDVGTIDRLNKADG